MKEEEAKRLEEELKRTQLEMEEKQKALQEALTTPQQLHVGDHEEDDDESSSHSMYKLRIWRRNLHCSLSTSGMLVSRPLRPFHDGHGLGLNNSGFGLGPVSLVLVTSLMHMRPVVRGHLTGSMK